MGEAITVGDPPIEVLVRRSARAKRMVLRLNRDTHAPILTVPAAVALRVAGAFARDQEDWIRRQIAASPPRIGVRVGASIPILGDETSIALQPSGPTRLLGRVLHVSGPLDAAPARVAAFVREIARSRCVDAAGRYAHDLGRRHGRITLRDPRSRWGSCTAAGDLNFSWRLAMAPIEVLDYVVAHEVAHLAEMNHSPRFWSVVARLCPDFAARRSWLRRHGPGLMAVAFR